MGRPSKNDKIRTEALKGLEQVKSKLHHKTFESYVVKIHNKRIDAVKRISIELKDLGKVKTNAKLSLPKAKAEIKENRTSHIKKLQHCIKGRYYYVRLVKSFNQTGTSVSMKSITARQLRAIVRGIDTTQRTILTVGDKHYTITPDKQKYLLNHIDDFFIKYDSLNKSDAECMLTILDTGHLTLSRPKWIGKNKNEGAFFKFYHNTSFDLDEFGIHRGKQEEYNENCFVQALISLGVDDNIITDVRKIICSKYIPTNKLTKIAEKFGLYIRVKTIDGHKDTKNFGKKGGLEILLGLIDQHYFAVKKVTMTKYSVTNYFDICDKEDFHLLFPNGAKLSKDLQGRRFTNSWDTIKYMYEHKDTYLTTIPYEDLLDSQYHNEATNIVNLEYTKENVKENVVYEKAETESKIVFFDNHYN